MKRRRAGDEGVAEQPAAEQEDPGVLADGSSDEDDVHNGESNSEGVSDDGDGFHDSDLDEGFDPDAEADGSSSGDEAACSSDEGEQTSDAAGVDSEVDAELDDAQQPHRSQSQPRKQPLDATGSVSSDDDDEDDSGDNDDYEEDIRAAEPSSKQQQHASFLEGGKSASFAKAFAKIMGKGSKAANTAAGNVILSESASLAKRKAEVAADEAAAREAKKQRLELKKRGHYKVPKKGADPAHDAREKQLQKLATRGVVLLFNAVNKAQKQKREAEAAGLKGAKALKAKPGVSSKAGFFAELKAGAQKAVTGLEGEQLVPGTAAGSRKPQQGSMQAANTLRLQDKQGPAKAAAAAEGGGGDGWDVLGEGFPGLTGGIKMKDWDKAVVEDEEMNGQALAGSDDDDEDDGNEAW